MLTIKYFFKFIMLYLIVAWWAMPLVLVLGSFLSLLILVVIGCTSSFVEGKEEAESVMKDCLGMASVCLGHNLLVNWREEIEILKER